MSGPVRLVVHRRRAERETTAPIRELFVRAAKECGDAGGAVAGAVVIVRRDGSVATAFDTGDDKLGLIAGVALLQRRLTEDR